MRRDTINAWEKRKLGNISEIRTGPFGSVLHAKDYVDDGVPIITTEHFKSGALPTCKFNLPQVSAEDFRRLKSYNLQLGDVVFSRVGSVDVSAEVLPLQDGWLFSGRVLRVRPKESVSGAFLHYVLSTTLIKRNIRSRAVGQTMPSINTKILNDTSIVLPHKTSEQNKISSALASLDSLIAATQQKIDILTEIRSVLQQRFFDQSMRFKNYSGLWERKKLGQLVTAYSGGTPRANESKYYNGDISFIRSAEIHQDRTALSITKEGLHHSSAKLVKRGDILYALYGANSGDVSRAKINGAINQAILAMLPKKNVNSDFLVYQLMNQEKYIVGTYLQGGQGNLSGKIVLDLAICIPSMVSEQEKIGTTLREFTNLISLMTNRRSKLEAVKKYLLQNLFN